MSLPNNCLKGIPHPPKEFLVEDGFVASHLFNFDSKHNRDDGWCEQSINWEDDKHAISFTLNQQKNGEIQFKIGLAIIARSELDRLNKQPAINGILSYERNRLEDNKYHGNLLIKSNTSKRLRKMISANIAAHVKQVIKRDV